MTLAINASEPYADAVRAVKGLLDKLKVEHAFVGNVALAAALGRRMESGPVDVLAMVTPERMRQVPMMASHHEFQVEPSEVEAAEELDLIPMRFRDIRIHILMASNALYGRMLKDRIEVGLGEGVVNTVRAEDLALLLLMGDRNDLVKKLMIAYPDFDVDALNTKLTSIGLETRRVSR